MGRILFVSFYDLNRPDFFFPFLSLWGIIGPIVRRKDLGKFRHSLPKKPVVCKPVFILLPCTVLPVPWLVAA